MFNIDTEDQGFFQCSQGPKFEPCTNFEKHLNLKKNVFKIFFTVTTQATKWLSTTIAPYITFNLGLVARKPVFGVSDKVRFKPEPAQLQRLARKMKFRL